MLPHACRALLFALVALIVFAPAALRAQSVQEPVQVYRLDLRQVPDIPEGTAALVDGIAGPRPQRFIVDNLHMLMPVSVTLRAVNAADVVNLRIVKADWDAPLRAGSTTGGQQVSVRFRTQGEFRLQVDSPQAGAPYKLVVWVGPDVQPQLPAVFVPRPPSGLGGIPTWWWLAGGAVLLLAVVVFLLARRRKAS